MRHLLILTLLLLTGCGFHLRGSVALPPALAEISVKGGVTDIAPELSRTLENAGVRVSDSAVMVLMLKAEKYDKRVLSVDSLGRAVEYGLSYSVRFSLKGKNGSVWISESMVIQTRDLRFDASAVLGIANEETQLKTEMRRDAALQIMRQLRYAKEPGQSPHPNPLPKGEGVNESESK